jgi:hypothetical protein
MAARLPNGLSGVRKLFTVVYISGRSSVRRVAGFLIPVRRALWGIIGSFRNGGELNLASARRDGEPQKPVRVIRNAAFIQDRTLLHQREHDALDCFSTSLP